MSLNDQYILDHFNEAIEKGRIRAYFQPIVRTLTGWVCCAEALARWEEPGLGLLSPAEFIPVLERHGLIYRLDLAVLHQACALYRALQDTGAPVHSLSVNFSRLDFARPDFFDAVVAALAEYGVPHRAIKIEITESVLFSDRRRFREVFDMFHEAGFRVWIDDFGSDYSSLGMLREFDFDLLKIDMQFIQSASPRSRRLIASIVNTAKALGVRTLVEGVETGEQLRFVRDVGCETIQGFYYSQPLDEAAFTAYLSGHRVEQPEEREYWNAIGAFDLLSPHPLEEGAARAAFQSDIPLALIECTWGRGDYVYANDAYLDSVRSLGFESIEALERYYNDRISLRYNPMRNLLTEAVMKNTTQEIDYISGNVLYKFKARCIAKSKALNRAMVVASLSTFKENADVRDVSELMHYSQALYASYEHVTLLLPDKDASIRVFSKANFQTAHQLKGLREGIRSFCDAEVHPEDRARYLRFFDLDTLGERLSEKGFIQQGFRISGMAGEHLWRQIRITQVPSVMETIYLYTIQSMSDVSVRIAKMLLKEHPELME